MKLADEGVRETPGVSSNRRIPSIVGISTDSVERLQSFGESHGVKFPLISDSGGDIVRLYGVRRWFGLGTSRVTYLIDKDGLIRDIHHSELFIAEHARRALARIEAAQARNDEL